MTVSEIISAVQGEFGTRNQLQVSDVLRLLNQIQLMAFDSDKPAFMVTDQFVTVSAGVKGPYNFPTNPPVRKFVGVTQYTVPQILGTGPAEAVIDYGLVLQSPIACDRVLYEDIIVDVFGKTFTFINDPSTEADTYRMVYYRRPKTITGALDDANLLIPAEYHHTLCVQGCVALADFSLYGKKSGRAMLQAEFFEPFWESMNGNVDPNKQNYCSEGSIGL